MIVKGIDTIQFGIGFDDYRREVMNYLPILHEWKMIAQGQMGEYWRDLHGVNMKVERGGFKMHPYALSNNDFSIGFMANPGPTNSPVSVKFGSGFLWSYGLSGAMEWFMRWFDSFGWSTVGTHLSRLDICVDTDEVQFVESDIKGIVTRAREKELHRPDSQYYSGREFSGLRVGSGKPMLARIYNKTMEIKRSHKEWFEQVWEQHGRRGDTDVWRVEFQLRRPALKSLGVTGVELVESVDERLWAYLTQEWLTLRRHEPGNTSRRPLKRKWGLIQSAGLTQIASPLVRQKVKVGNLEQLKDQVSGALVSIAALGGYSDLNSTLVALGQRVEERFRNKQTSFEIEVEQRRKRFVD